MTTNDRALLTIEALEYFQTLPTKLLVAAIRGDIDLNAIARLELANRGLDREGRWVGFERARQIHSSVCGVGAGTLGCSVAGRGVGTRRGAPSTDFGGVASPRSVDCAAAGDDAVSAKTRRRAVVGSRRPPCPTFPRRNCECRRRSIGIARLFLHHLHRRHESNRRVEFLGAPLEP
jgi:hypothetical protein